MQGNQRKKSGTGGRKSSQLPFHKHCPPIDSLHICAKVFRYAQYFLHKKWVCKVGIFGVLCLNQTCSVHTKIAIFVKMASARPPRDVGALQHLLLQICVPVFALYLFCYNATCSCLHVLLCLRRLLFLQVSNLLPYFAFHTRDRVCKQSRHYFFLFC